MYNKVGGLVEKEKLTDLVMLAKMDGKADESAVATLAQAGGLFFRFA